MTLCHILPDRRGWVNMITYSFWTQLNVSKHCITKNSTKTSVIFYVVEWSNSSIYNNSILLSHLFNYQAVIFNPEKRPYQVLPLRATIELEAIAMKKYSAFLKASGLKPTHQMQFSVIPKIFKLVIQYRRQAAQM